jgi:peptidoglycan/LPS O-acetylase OafA/YrhL
MGTIRFLLALSVVINHSVPFFGMTMVGGKLAVQAFFVISGFYMSLILHEKYPAGAGGTWLFYSNRFLRIYPIYWAVLSIPIVGFIALFCAEHLLTLFLNRYLPAVAPAEAFWELSADKIAFLVVTNISLVGMDLSYFLRFDLAHLAFTDSWRLHQPSPASFYLVPQAWSLAIEVLVYAIAPFIFRRSVRFLFAILVLSFAIRTAAFDAGYDYDPWNYRFFPFELGLFVAGSLLYRFYRAAPRLVERSAAGYLSLGLGIASIIGYPFVPPIAGSLLGFERREFLFLATFMICVPAIFALSRTWKLDRWIGELSYPIYLCHLLVVQACNGRFGWEGVNPIAGSVVISIILATAVETPLDRFRQARIRRRARLEPATGLPIPAGHA